jgi:glycosyltransferase involved in cell wall biosynthesis
MTGRRRVLLDDVFLSLARTGVARVWEQVLRNAVSRDLFEKNEIEMIIVNRSDVLVDLGVQTVSFPEYRFAQPAHDRFLLSMLAEQSQADLFVSTYYTFVPALPSVLMVYDLIPEAFGFSTESRAWLERKLAILQASSYVSISKSTTKDLRAHYPFVHADDVLTAHPAVNLEVFRPRALGEIRTFREKFGLAEDYWVMVGSRYQQNHYKNAGMVLEAMTLEGFPTSDVVFVGGEPLTEHERESAAALGVRLLRIELDDEGLANCLSGARALVYPSLYEGFGLPPLEALACGVPVICTSRASLPEAVGDLALYIGGEDPRELVQKLELARSSAVREHFLTEGPAWASTFSWDALADALVASMRATPIGEDRPYVDRLVVRSLEKYTSRVRRIQV